MRSWGRLEADAPVDDRADLATELREAYRRGRRDESRRHRRSPLITTVLIAIAAIGAVVLFQATREGSFTSGGQVIDAKLNHVTGQVLPGAVNDAATRAGGAMQSVGRQLKDHGSTLDRQAANPPASN